MRHQQLRTTLQLDDDVLASARVLAGQRGESLGAVIQCAGPPGPAPARAAERRAGLPAQ